MARIRNYFIVESTEDEVKGFDIPDGWRAYWDQWLTGARTVDLFNSKNYGCAGCKNADDCETRKAVCIAMGENYPIFPKDWLTITPEDYDAYSETSRILCRIRLASAVQEKEE